VPVVIFSILAILVMGASLVALYFVLATRRIAAHAEKMVPPSGKFVDIGGNRIHYVEAGEGPPIVFIHGLGAQFHQFRHPLFGRLADSYRLVALDRPGSGYSVRAKGAGAGLSEQARTIVRFMERLGLEKPLLVGHSLGGMVALTIAIEHPDSLSGLALLAPLTRYSDKVAPEFAPLHIAAPWWRWLLSRTIAIPKALKSATATLDFMFGPQPVPVDYAVEGGGYSGLRPGHFYATSSDLVALGEDMKRLTERYGEIRIPTGILFGSADRVLSHQAHGLAMRDRIAGLDLEIIEGIGHMPQFVATDRVEAFIRRMAERAALPFPS
jgi:pimeloyl-ACP methyl ester carboxylesterase